MKNPAAVAYEAYRTHMNGLSHRGAFLVGWDYLPDVEKRGWFRVVSAVVADLGVAPKAIQDRFTDPPPADGRTRRRSRRADSR